MRGQVLGVDTRTGDGIVTGDDGRRYSFKPEDWAARGEPAIGMLVDFEASETRALTIFPVPGAAPAAPPPAAAARNDRNRLVAAVLAFVVGVFGVHRFYLGRTGSGLVMLILTCTMVGLLLTGPWALIDMVRYLVMSDSEFETRYARD
jgi:hypothetical protein